MGWAVDFVLCITTLGRWKTQKRSFSLEQYCECRGLARIFQRERGGGSHCVKQRVITRLSCRPPSLFYLCISGLELTWREGPYWLHTRAADENTLIWNRFKKSGLFKTVFFFAVRIWSWRFRHLNIVGCFPKKAFKGGLRVPQDPFPLPTPMGGRVKEILFFLTIVTNDENAFITLRCHWIQGLTCCCRCGYSVIRRRDANLVATIRTALHLLHAVVVHEAFIDVGRTKWLKRRKDWARPLFVYNNIKERTSLKFQNSYNTFNLKQNCTVRRATSLLGLFSAKEKAGGKRPWHRRDF